MKRKIIWTVVIVFAGATGILWAMANSATIALAAIGTAVVALSMAIPLTLMDWEEQEEQTTRNKPTSPPDAK